MLLEVQPHHPSAEGLGGSGGLVMFRRRGLDGRCAGRRRYFTYDPVDRDGHGGAPCASTSSAAATTLSLCQRQLEQVMGSVRA